MSTTIDERVVEMRFDNKQFESNVATSMSTLDKLKRSLRLDGASKGLEDVNSAAKRVDMSGLGGAVDSVKAKFSAMDVMAVTALANITNSAINAGKRMVSALTIDPIKTGFQEYETQINAVQTILANTSSKGTTIDDVNAALDELNRYADLTIYNFTEMTRNIGTFTAAGVDLETSVNAIQGIANLAAVSGSTSQQASTAMYQLSQALAAGTVKLMDWNSVVNAGMGGEVFQNALKETSKLLGTGAEAAIEAEGSFRESLRTGWLTSEVLTETLKKFTTSGAVEYISKFTGLSEETIDAVIESTDAWGDEKDAIDKAAEALANKSGKNKDEIKAALDMAKTAQDAATKVKTFTQLWDVLKEAAQSGWSQTWRIIIGDFEDAKALLTPLSDRLTSFINKMSDWRNTILQIALDFEKPWKSISEKLNSAGFNKIKDIANSFENVSDKVKTASEKLEYFQDIVNKVWRGDFNNWGDDPDRRDLLTEAGYDHRVVQDLVNKGYQYKLTIEDVEAAHKKFGLTMETTTEKTKNTTSAFAELTDEQLKQAGLTEDEISLYRALEKESRRLDISVSKLIEDMSTTDGRTLLIDSFKNAADGLIGIGKAIKNAWIEIFNPSGASELAIKLYGIIRSLNEFSEKLRLTDKETGKLNETGKKIQRTFKGIFAVLDIVKTIVGGGLKIAFNVLSSILSAFNLDILDVTANIGDALVAFRDWALEGNALAKAFNWLISKIPVVVKNLKTWFDVFKQTPAVQKLVDAVNAIYEAFSKLTNGEIDIAEFAALLGNNLAKALKALPGIAIQIGKDFIKGFQNGLGDSVSGIIDKIVKFCVEFVSAFKEALGVQSPSWKAYDTAVDFFQGFINGAKAMIEAVLSVLKNIGGQIVKAFRSFWDFITDESGNIEWGKIFAGGIIVSMIWVLKQLATAFSGIANALSGIDDLLVNAGKVLKSFSKVLNGIAWDLKAKALMKMAISIGILVASIWVLTQIDDIGKLWNAVIVIGVLAGILIGLSYAMSKLSSVSVIWDKEGPKIDGIKSGLIQIGIAIFLLAATVKMIGDMDPTKAAQGFKGLAAISVGLMIFLAAIGGITRYSKNISDVGGMMIKLSIAMALMVYACKLVGRLSEDEMLKGAAFAIAFSIFVIAITKVAKSAGNNVNKVGGMVLKISIAMAIMVGVCKLIGKLSIEEMAKGAVFAGAFALFIKYLVSVTKIGKKQQLANLNGLVLSISVSLLLLVGVCKLVGKLSVEEMLKGAAFVTAFLFLLKVLVSILSISNEQKIAKVAGVILSMSIAIGILAAVSVLLSFVDLKSLAKGITAVSILSVMMTLMIKSLKGAQNVKGSLIAMTVVIGLMAAAVVALSFIDIKSLTASTVAMVALMGMFTLMVRSLKGLKKVSMGPIIALTGVMLVLAGIVYLLKDIDPSSAISSAGSLAVLMVAMTVALSIINSIKLDVLNALAGMIVLTAFCLVLREFVWVLASMEGLKNARDNAITLTILAGACTVMLAMFALIGGAIVSALAGIVGLAALGLVLREFVWVLASMEGLKNARDNAITLTILAGACTVMLAVLTLIGFALPAALAGIVGLAALGLVLREFVWVLASMEGLKNATSNAMILMMLMTSIGDVLVKISLLGPLAIIGETAVAGLVALIGVIGVLATGIGALMDKFPSIQKFLDTGLPVLEQLASSIGTMIGNLVGGILTGIGNAVIQLLPQLSKALSEFMVGIQPFINIASNIDSSVIAGVGYLTSAILCLTVADFIAGITQIINGGLSFTDLGTQLLLFGIGVTSFFNLIKDIDSSAIEASTNIANMILVLTASEAISSLTEKFGGSTDFSSIGEKLKTFGEAIVGFSDTINGKIDTSAVQAATSAGSMLVELNKSLPRSGGWIQEIIGEQDLKKFATSCKAFANCILDINEVVSQEGFLVQSEKMSQIVTAGTKFNELNTALPKTGGIAQDLAGEQDLARFGTACVAFIDCMIAINKAVSTEGFLVQSEKMSQLVTAGTKFNELNTALPKTGGVAQDLAGEQDLARFGTACVAFVDCMVLVNTALNNEGFAVNLEGMEALKQAGLKMNELQNALPKTGGWWQEIAGAKDIGDFGEKIKTFAEAIASFSTVEIGNSDLVLNTAYRIKALITSLSDLDTSGLETFTGIGTGGFGADGAAYKIAQTIAEFSDKVAGIDTEAVSVSVSAATKLKTLISNLSGLDTSGIENFKVGSIGDQMKDYANKVSGIDIGTVSSSISAANRLKNFIAGLAGLDTSGISNFKVGSIGTAIKTYGNSVSGINIGAVSNSILVATKLRNFIASLAGINGKGVSSFKTAINQLSTVNIAGLVKAFSGASLKLYSAGSDMITGLIKGIQSKISDVNTVSIKLIAAMNNTLKSKIPVFGNIGQAFIAKLVSGIGSKKSTVNSAVSSCLSSAVSKIRDKYTSFYNAGSYLVTGFSDGISDNSYKAAAKAKAMAEAAEKAARDALKINSPSKVFKVIGSGIPEGFAMGINMLGGMVKRSVSDMAFTAIDSTRSTMSNILDVLSGNIDVQPTIRPVIDLTDIQTGANTINGMFNKMHTVGVRSNLNAINSAMNNKLQNSTNDDIISAINKLKDGLDNRPGDVYNFGDFTYDNGDEVSEAVGVLVRAAKMGRRV